MRRPFRFLLIRSAICCAAVWFTLEVFSNVDDSDHQNVPSNEVVIDPILARQVHVELDHGNKEGHTLPYSVAKALHIASRNGFLVGNSSSLTFKVYPEEVDLRIIVLAYNRPKSLKICLDSLKDVDYLQERVSLHVWIDRHQQNNTIPTATYQVAKHFRFKTGYYRIHVHPQHVGIQGQWINTWRPQSGSKEIALILEDDMTVSPFFYRWLGPAHRFYDNRTDLAGYGLSYPGIAHGTGHPLIIPRSYNVYLYRVIVTHGFSPHATSWRKFQDWFYQVEQDGAYQPLVQDILPSQWFLQHQDRGRERDLWEMWHICFTHNASPPQYTLVLNSVHEGLLAVTRNEDKGLHDPGEESGIAREPLCGRWKPWYVRFPVEPPKIDYNGMVEGIKYEEEEDERYTE